MDREKLFYDHMDLVDTHRFTSSQGAFDDDDLRQFLLEALFRCTFTWNPGRGYEDFRSFAARRLLWARQDFFRTVDPMSRTVRREYREDGGSGIPEIPLRGALQDDYEIPIADPSPPPIDSLIRDEQRELVSAVLDELPPKERYILIERFCHERTLRSIGDDFGLSESRVSQLMERTLRRIRKDVHELAA